MKKRLTIVTGNDLKFKELSHVLNELFDCEQGIFSTYEIQGKKEDIIVDKLRRAHEFFGHAVLVDDTSFEIEDLGGFPGPYMKDLTKAMTIQSMGEYFDGKKATVVGILGLTFGGGQYIISEGTVHGTIKKSKAHVPEDSLNFDPIFVPEGHAHSFSEMTLDEKNSTSHRGKALEALIEKLTKPL